MHLAVDASRVVGEARASGMVNAVLRRFVAQRAELLAAVDAGPAPGGTRIRAGWSMHCTPPGASRRRILLAANNQHPPMALRVDPGAADGDRFPASLARAGARGARRRLEPRSRGAGASRRGTDAARVRVGRGVRAGLRARSWPRRYSTRGPACACSMPARRPAARHCILRNARRRSVSWWPSIMIRCALQRVRGKSRARRPRGAADQRGPDGAGRRRWRRASFDRVLVDAPCSGSGVIRRHPDIKLLRRPSDIDAFAATQRRILAHRFRTTSARRASHLLHLLGDCQAENESVVAAFLARGTARRPGRLARRIDAAARAHRTRRRLAVAARWRCGHRWLLLCLPALDFLPGITSETNAYTSRASTSLALLFAAFAVIGAARPARADALDGVLEVRSAYVERRAGCVPAVRARGLSRQRRHSRGAQGWPDADLRSRRGGDRANGASGWTRPSAEYTA